MGSLRLGLALCSGSSSGSGHAYAFLKTSAVLALVSDVMLDGLMCAWGHPARHFPLHWYLAHSGFFPTVVGLWWVTLGSNFKFSFPWGVKEVKSSFMLFPAGIFHTSTTSGFRLHQVGGLLSLLASPPSGVDFFFRLAKRHSDEEKT